jgi:hypothetical protein
LARSLAVSLSIVWFASRPLIAAYIPPIIGMHFLSRPPR